MEGQEPISMEDAIKQSLNTDAPAPETPVATPEAQTEQEPETKAEPALPVATLIEDDPAATPATPNTFDEIAWIKQHFGEDFDSVDKIKSKITAEPPAPKEHTFENETSKKIYEALLSGKEGEVADYLSKKQFVAALKEKSPEEIVKAGWKTEYGLTDAEAERKFQKQYTVDPFADDEDKPIEQKMIAKQIEKEADNYKKFFAQYEQDIKLPSIEEQQPQAQAAAQVDYTSEAAKRAIAFAESLNTSSTGAPGNIPFEFSDTNLKLKGQVAIPAAEVTKIKTQLEGQEDKFIENRWFKNGEFNGDLFYEDIYYLTNRKAIANAVASQVAHKARVEYLKENRNYQADNVIKGDFMPSEDEQKREWYRKYMM